MCVNQRFSSGYKRYIVMNVVQGRLLYTFWKKQSYLCMEIKQKKFQISRNVECAPKNQDCYLWKKLFAENNGNIRTFNSGCWYFIIAYLCFLKLWIFMLIVKSWWHVFFFSLLVWNNKTVTATGPEHVLELFVAQPGMR